MKKFIAVLIAALIAFSMLSLGGCEFIDELMEQNDAANGYDYGYNADVDYLRSVMTDGKGYIERIANEEREKTGIRTLKVGYNKVFGYYIEVSKSFVNEVPAHYIRKQTLTNAERYITSELKDLESRILGAKDRAVALEYDLFVELCDKVKENAAVLQDAAKLLAQIDVYASLAHVALENHYVCPVVDFSDRIEIEGGRHPVVEQVTKGFFVPNDTTLDCEGNRMAIITGPNMAGKSTYMRQCAIIVIMAQMGSFVPAKEARVGIVDKIFTAVQKKYEIKREDIVGDKRTKDIANARHITVYVIRSVTDMSLPNIGKILNRDHTTIMSSINTVERLMAKNPVFRTEIEELVKEIKGL